jgi:hypothetical protein
MADLEDPWRYRNRFGRPLNRGPWRYLSTVATKISPERLHEKNCVNEYSGLNGKAHIMVNSNIWILW